MSAYFVQHSMLGPHVAGECIEISPADEKNGVDVQRLLELGAMREATEEEAGSAVPLGQGSIDAPRVFPPVPFQNVQEVTEASGAAPAGSDDAAYGAKGKAKGK